MPEAMTSSDLSVLSNICMAAYDKYMEDAKAMKRLAYSGGNGLMTAKGAERLVEQFTRQANDALAWKRFFDNEPTIRFVEGPDEEVV